MRALGAEHFISGPSARAYLDEAKLAAEQVTLEYMRYEYPEYEQLHPPYDPQVSILDLLFMRGEGAGELIWGRPRGRGTGVSTAPLELSVVTMLYRSEGYLREFHARALAAAAALTPQFELVYVDDGSPDASAATVRELAAGDPRVVLVELSRNFGHHRAAVAGLTHARGRRVFILDVDLEERPEWLSEFAAQMDGSGADVVFGVSVVRKGTFFRRVLGGVFWKLFNALSDVRFPRTPARCG
jgi:cellulose synthase/poly-beta-1,6-N-acetylglucosamine synthase-like glycosyltransferase